MISPTGRTSAQAHRASAFDCPITVPFSRRILAVVAIRPWRWRGGPELFSHCTGLSQARQNEDLADGEDGPGASRHRVRDRAGVADFHAAGRHTHITELLRSGASLTEARELARHSDIRMTMKYTHIGIDDQAKAVSKLPWQRKR